MFKDDERDELANVAALLLVRSARNTRDEWLVELSDCNTDELLLSKKLNFRSNSDGIKIIDDDSMQIDLLCKKEAEIVLEKCSSETEYVKIEIKVTLYKQRQMLIGSFEIPKADLESEFEAGNKMYYNLTIGE